MILPYSEGSVFFVPLRNGGYARGVVARASSEGGILFGYFFGPRLESMDGSDFDDMKPTKSILRLRFGDLGLINGEWPIRNGISNWNRAEWPMPDFVRRDPLGRRKPVIVRYSDTDPSRVDCEFCAVDDKNLAGDFMSGYGAIEIKLTKILE